jgi:tRNA(Ile)-lysidine synthase
MDLLEGLETFFFDQAPLARGDRLVVAFSGGGDSTALLWGLAQLAPAWGIGLAAAHLDHAMDPLSGTRAAQARDLARRLGVPLVSARRRRKAAGQAAAQEIAGQAAGREIAGQAAEREIAGRGTASRGREADARRIRYEFLEEVRRRCGARYVATAHHRDDQAETVLVRLAFGSGLRGLAGIRPVASGGTVVRPLLGLPRAILRDAVAAAGLRPAEDPGNADPRQPRSRMRHRVLPALAAARGGVQHPATPQAADGEASRQQAARQDELVELLARLAAGARRALPILDRRLAEEIGLELGGGGGAVDAGAADRRRLAALPPPLLVPALVLLHHQAGIAYPASRAAAGELRLQLSGSAARRVGCDCGAGWRWNAGEETLCLRRAAPREAAPPFTYTLEVPGSLYIPEIAATISVSERPVESCMSWLRRGAPDRAVLALPLPRTTTATAPGAPRPEALPAPAGLTVRNRRPGDRLWPLGSPGSRKLKAVLIDRRVPAERRDRLPLLCWAGEIAWVPGVTIGHRFRVAGQSRAWLAELAYQP